MKTIRKITSILLALVMLSLSAFAGDITLKSVKITSQTAASSVPGASPNGTVAIENGTNAHGEAVKVFNISPSSRIDVNNIADSSCSNFAVQIPFKPASADARFYVFFKHARNGATHFDQVVQYNLKDSGKYGLNNSEIAAACSLGWQTLTLLYNESPARKIDVYVDNTLIGTYTTFALTTDEYKSAGLGLRFGVSGADASKGYGADNVAVEYIDVFHPGLVQLTSETDRIVKNTDPVTVSFSRGVKPTGDAPFGNDNIVIKDADGNVITDAVQSVTPIADAAGFVTKAVLTFAPDKLIMDETYYIEATGCADIFGKAVASGDALDDVGGNSFIYAPYPFTLSIANADRELDYLDETVTFELSEPIKAGSDGNAEFSKDNVIVTDSSGTPVALSSAEPVAYSDGRVTEVELTFAEGALKYDSKYTIKIVGCIGLYNQPYEAPNDGSDSFVTLSAPFGYSWKTVKVYKGIGSKKAPVSALSKGMISVEAEYANSGRLSESVTLVCEVYQGEALVSSFETAGRTLASKASHKAVFGLWLSNAGADTKINLTLKNSAGTQRLTKKGAELFEN